MVLVCLCFFTDIIDMQPFTIFNVSFIDTVFETNYDFTHQPPVTCLSDLEYNIECLPMADAAGLTLKKVFLLKLMYCMLE